MNMTEIRPPFEGNCSHCGTAISEKLQVPFTIINVCGTNYPSCTKHECVSAIQEEKMAEWRIANHKEPISQKEWNKLPIHKRIFLRLQKHEPLTPEEEKAIHPDPERERVRPPAEAFMGMITRIAGTGQVNPDNPNGDFINYSIGASLKSEEWDALIDIYDREGAEGLRKLVPPQPNSLPNVELSLINPETGLSGFDRRIRHVAILSFQRKADRKLKSEREAEEQRQTSLWEAQSIELACHCRISKAKALSDLGFYLGKYGQPARLRCSVGHDWDYETPKKLLKSADTRIKVK